MTLDGRTALVTGAARGIGLAITERLLRDGCRVALLDRDGEVEAVAKRLGAGTVALVADVTRTDDVDRSVQRVVATWGRLDVVVNNAGITGRSYPIWELSDEELAPGDHLRPHQGLPGLPGRHPRHARRRARPHHPSIS